jgi:hypothetical protein
MRFYQMVWTMRSSDVRPWATTRVWLWVGVELHLRQLTQVASPMNTDSVLTYPLRHDE